MAQRKRITDEERKWRSMESFRLEELKNGEILC